MKKRTINEGSRDERIVERYLTTGIESAQPICCLKNDSLVSSK